MRTHISAGKVFTGLSRTAVRDQTVVVDDETIAFVGSTESAPRPCPGDNVIDHSGLFIMPGLIDLHVHLAYGNAKSAEDIDLYASVEFRALRGLFLAQRVLAAGFTSVLDPGTSG